MLDPAGSISHLLWNQTYWSQLPSLTDSPSQQQIILHLVSQWSIFNEIGSVAQYRFSPFWSINWAFVNVLDNKLHYRDMNRSSANHRLLRTSVHTSIYSHPRHLTIEIYDQRLAGLGSIQHDVLCSIRLHLKSATHNRFCVGNRAWGL